MYGPSKDVDLVSRSLQVRQANPDHELASVSAVEKSQSADGGTNNTSNPSAIGIIFGTLAGVAIVLFILYLLYSRRHGSIVHRLAWWRPAKSADETDGSSASGPLSTVRSSSAGASMISNESGQNLVKGSPQQPAAGSILQKIQLALLGSYNQKTKLEDDPADVEKGHRSGSSTSTGDASSDNGNVNGDALAEHPVPTEAAPVSIESPAAHHPAYVQRREDLLPTSDNPAKAKDTSDHPDPCLARGMQFTLSSLPADRDTRRDTTMTTMSEDMQPTKHRSINSWVTNMQTRQQKREQHLQQGKDSTLSIDSSAASRYSAMTFDSDMSTPVLQTARTARHPSQGVGQIEMRPPPPPKSESTPTNPEAEALERSWPIRTEREHHESSRQTRVQSQHMVLETSDAHDHDKDLAQAKLPRPEEEDETKDEVEVWPNEKVGEDAKDEQDQNDYLYEEYLKDASLSTADQATDRDGDQDRDRDPDADLDDPKSSPTQLSTIGEEEGSTAPRSPSQLSMVPEEEEEEEEGQKAQSSQLSTISEAHE
jgi:hypothetical protein